jgi:hypothetical protein
MLGLILAPFVLIISILLSLLKPLRLFLKITGLWVVAVYLIGAVIVNFTLNLSGKEPIMDYFHLGLNTSNDYAWFGLKCAIVISCCLFVLRTFRLAFRK